jgi:large subunit ribosomal protein L9
MAKTEVILTQPVASLGAESDHVKVAAGYARNYLFPQGLAIPLTAANKRRLEALKQRRGAREAHELNSMTELAQGLAKLLLTIKVKTGEDGKLFGSVTSGTIADELRHQFEVTVDKRKIQLDQPIKQVGDYEIDLRLHPDAPGKLKVKVESTTPPPKREEAPRSPAPEAEAAAQKPATEKRKRKLPDKT